MTSIQYQSKPIPGQENHGFQYRRHFPSNEPGSLSNFHVSD